jgi:hypothetical protein
LSLRDPDPVFEVHRAGVPEQRLPLPCLDMAGEQQRIRSAARENGREASASLTQWQGAKIGP